jgi:hypothetical protein
MRAGWVVAVWMAAAVAAHAEDAKKGPANRGAAALVARAVEAFGGAAAVDQVTGLEIKGRGTRRTEGGSDVPLTMVTRFHLPDLYYQELRLPMITITTVASPKGAFVVAGGAALPLPDEERENLVKLVRRQVVFLLRARNETAFRAAAAGPATVDGRSAERLDVTYQGDTVRLVLDAATGQVVQSEYATPAGGAPGRMVITYSDPRQVGNGLRYPHGLTAVVDSKPAFTLQIESVAVNPPIDEASFAAPPSGPPSPGPDAPSASPSAAPPSPPSPSVSPRE